jgi:hypothetical protein
VTGDVWYLERDWGCISLGKFFNSCVWMDGQIFFSSRVFLWFVYVLVYMTAWMLVALDAGLEDFFFCGWMVGFVFGYLLNEFMFAGVFIFNDTDLICYLFFLVCLLLLVVLMIVGYLGPL